MPGLDLDLGAVDGTLTRAPDTKANRAAYGSAGTGDDSSPYPQLRDLLVSDAYTRATLAVLTGPSGGDKPRPSRNSWTARWLSTRGCSPGPAVGA